ncbi:MAG: stage II sporulation protein P [Clostridia bacterium]|nr:stage II sporulation protein P [Clostridia bacterium]
MTKYFPNIKELFKKLICFFTLYALIPLICGGFLGLFLFIEKSGTSKALETMEKIGRITLSTVIGGETKKEKSFSGFYLLSPEIHLPAHESMTMVIGSGTYFRPITKESETQDSPKNTSSLPTNAVPIISCDLSSTSFFINTTKYTIDLEEARNAAFPAQTTIAETPLVLILHTHGTESYFEDPQDLSQFAEGEIEGYFLKEETSFRSDNPEKSVIQVGKVFAETLIGEGIPAIHCQTMHDKDDFNDAYAKSAETVQEMLKKYPSIQYVIDLHRDSVVRGDSYVKSLTTINGTPSAQVMLVVGTNQNGKHPNWKQNLIVATGYKDKLDALYPSLSRSLYLRTSRFNQEFLPGCMLLEVGSCANTLEEAENAARFSAVAFAEMIKTKK